MNQKIKTVIKYIILTAAVLAGAYFYSFVKMNGSTVMQTGNTAYFKCEGKDLSAVKVALLTSGEAEENIDFYLLDENGSEVRHITKDVSGIADGEQIKFSFDKIRTSRDKKYTVKLIPSSEKVSVAPGTAVWYSYVGFRVETMIVFVLCIAYLIGLAKALSFIFRK